MFVTLAQVHECSQTILLPSNLTSSSYNIYILCGRIIEIIAAVWVYIRALLRFFTVSSNLFLIMIVGRGCFMSRYLCHYASQEFFSNSFVMIQNHALVYFLIY